MQMCSIEYTLSKKTTKNKQTYSASLAQKKQTDYKKFCSMPKPFIFIPISLFFHSIIFTVLESNTKRDK
jgi:hypothetical protein